MMTGSPIQGRCGSVYPEALNCATTAAPIAIRSEGNQCSFLTSRTWEAAIKCALTTIPFFFFFALYSEHCAQGNTYLCENKSWNIPLSVLECLRCQGNPAAIVMLTCAHTSDQADYRRFCIGVYFFLFSFFFLMPSLKHHESLCINTWTHENWEMPLGTTGIFTVYQISGRLI